MSRNKKQRQKNILIIVVIISLLFLLYKSTPAITPIDRIDVPDTAWLEDYKKELPEEYKQYTVETEYYDYSHPAIQEIDNAILSVARNEQEFVQLSLDYVFENVPYNQFESNEVCFKATSSSVIKSKTGNCDTQAMSVISILRGAGIATRSVGGCLSLDPNCKLKLAVFSLFGIEEKKPKWVELGEINISQESFSRRQIPQEASRSGGLHLWISAFFDANGDGRREWIILEETSGKIIDEKTSCYRYDLELFPDETDDERRYNCISDNIEFMIFCSQR